MTIKTTESFLTKTQLFQHLGERKSLDVTSLNLDKTAVSLKRLKRIDELCPKLACISLVGCEKVASSDTSSPLLAEPETHFEKYQGFVADALYESDQVQKIERCFARARDLTIILSNGAIRIESSERRGLKGSLFVRTVSVAADIVAPEWCQVRQEVYASEEERNSLTNGKEDEYSKRLVLMRRATPSPKLRRTPSPTSQETAK